MLRGLFTATIQAMLLLFMVALSVLASWPASAQYKRAVTVETSVAKSEVLPRQIVIEGRVRSGLPYEVSAPLKAVTKIEKLRNCIIFRDCRSNTFVDTSFVGVMRMSGESRDF